METRTHYVAFADRGVYDGLMYAGRVTPFAPWVAVIQTGRCSFVWQNLADQTATAEQLGPAHATSAKW